MDCANHVCVSPSAGGGGRDVAPVDCPHCHSVAYCSEQCRYVDWVKHDCANVVRVGASADTLFVPYHYEDTFTEAELGEPTASNAAVLVQSYVTVHHAEDHTMTSSVVPALIALDSSTGWTSTFVTPGRGVNPSKHKLGDAAYAIYIEEIDEDERVVRSLAVAGTFRKDAIYEENKNDRVRRLLGKVGWAEDKVGEGEEAPSAVKRGLRRFGDLLKRGARRATSLANNATSSVIMWPDVADAYSGTAVGVQFPLAANLRIVVSIGSKAETATQKVIHVRGGYDLGKTSDQSRMSANVKKAMEVRLKGKFKDTAGLKTFRAHAQGITAVIAFRLEKGMKFATVADIEVVVPVQILQYAAAQPAARLIRSLKDVDMSSDEEEVPLPPVRDDGDERSQAQIGSTIAFRCDPSSTAQLVGLTMALENTFATNKRAAADASLQQAAGVVRKYTRACLDAPADAGASRQDVPMDVNTAIRSATEKLYEYNVSTRA